jgi:hypothetical protein|tara:strand:- start:8375 stop:8575 length:201 start_codon:yes stop_codon:yes gene_type:complete
MRIIHFLQASLLLLAANEVYAQPLISEPLTFARAPDVSYISWQEHIIDRPEIARFALSASDGRSGW